MKRKDGLAKFREEVQSKTFSDERDRKRFHHHTRVKRRAPGFAEDRVCKHYQAECAALLTRNRKGGEINSSFWKKKEKSSRDTLREEMEEEGKGDTLLLLEK